jgi:hypothetical protein
LTAISVIGQHGMDSVVLVNGTASGGVYRRLITRRFFALAPFIECLPQFYPIDGRATPASPGDIVEYPVPDMFERLC